MILGCRGKDATCYLLNRNLRRAREVQDALRSSLRAKWSRISTEVVELSDLFDGERKG